MSFFGLWKYYHFGLLFALWYNRFMDKKYEKISQDLGVTLKQIDTVLSLTAEGATIPFIARYRKDMTGSLDEVAIKAIIDLDKSLTKKLSWLRFKNKAN